MKAHNRTVFVVAIIAVISIGSWLSQLWGTNPNIAGKCSRTLTVPWQSTVALPCDWSFCQNPLSSITEGAPFASVQKKPSCAVGFERSGPEGSLSDVDVDFTYFIDQRGDFTTWLNGRKNSLEGKGLLFQMVGSLPNGADASFTAVDTEGRFDSRFPYVLQKFYWRLSENILEAAVYIPKSKFDENQRTIREILESVSSGIRTSIVSVEEGTTFSSPKGEISFVYPRTLELVSEVPDESGLLAEFRTQESVSWYDDVAQQKVSGPLYTLLLYHVSSPALVDTGWLGVLIDAFSHYITTASSAVDEQERVRMDVDGRYGVRQWVWHKNNPVDFSSFTYYLLDGNEVWQLSAWVNLDDPASAKFKSVRQEIEQIFASVGFSS